MEDEGEEEKKKEEAASPLLVVNEEGTEASAEPGALGAAAEPELEPEDDAVGQDEEAKAAQLRFRRRRWQRKKQPKVALEEGEHQFPFAPR